MRIKNVRGALNSLELSKTSVNTKAALTNNNNAGARCQWAIGA